MNNRRNKIFSLKNNWLPLFLAAMTYSHEVLSEAAPDQVTATAQAFLAQQAAPLGDEVTVTITPSPAQLPACENPQAFLPFDRPVAVGNLTVGIRCGADNRQVRYLGAHVSALGHYLTTAAFLPAGTTVEMASLEEKYGDLSHLPGQVITSRDQALGKTTKLSLKPGTVLLPHHLDNPPAISRGEAVLISTRGQGFKITRPGEALESGGLGDTIRVRLPNRQTVATTVTAPGVVSIATR